MMNQLWCPQCAAPMATQHNVLGTTFGNLFTCTNPSCRYSCDEGDHRTCIPPNDFISRCSHCHLVHGMDTTGRDPRCPRCGGRL
jgi:hypothetical protein